MQNGKVYSDNVSIRDFLPENIAPLVTYWTQNSEEFWKVHGVDKSKLKSEKEFTEIYQNAFRQFGGVKTLAIILFKEKAIGVHGLFLF